MKDYAKVGNRRGKPAYRTPSSFRYQQHLKTQRYKISENQRIKKN